MNGNSPIFGTPEGWEQQRKNEQDKRLRNIERMLQQLTVEEDKALGNHPVTVGDIVFYKITAEDIEEHYLAGPACNRNVKVGDEMPAIITRLFSDYTFANMTVFTDNGFGNGAFQVFSKAFIGRVAE